jgi:uncharacterized repeat protein (TIGR03806 family)
MIKFYYRCLLCVLGGVIVSCNTDDSVSPMLVEANPDSAVLAQNTTAELFVFSNDLNVPNTGSLTLTTAQKGLLEVLDPNTTPDNPSDDIILYTANPNQTGNDQFQYTICDASDNCSSATVSITITSETPVNYNLDAMPYPTLSEYNFFVGDLKDLEPGFGVVPYVLNSSLFSDYAKKKRFIWMPNNTAANYLNDNVTLDFPLGAVIIKNFYYENVIPDDVQKIIETRIMIKKDEGWVFANYVWNDEQTEANFDLNGSTVNIEWLQNGEVKSADYRIPSGSECMTCHKIQEIPKLIGPKPRNLNLTYPYNDGPQNQLNKLAELGYLENAPMSVATTVPDYNDLSQPLELRARAYLDINCAHCHSEETHCSYRPLRLDFADTEVLSNMGVCIDPDTDLGGDLGHIIEPGDSRSSVLHFRMNSTDPSVRMPLIGRDIVHSEGVSLIEEWIDSLSNDCN